MVTRSAGSNIPGGFEVSREAAPRGVHKPAKSVLPTQASAVSKPAYNSGGVDRSKGRMGQTLEESILFDDGVLDGRGVIEMVREPGEMEDSVTIYNPALPVRKARAVETVVLECVISGGGRVCSRDRLVVDIWPVRREERVGL